MSNFSGFRTAQHAPARCILEKIPRRSYGSSRVLAWAVWDGYVRALVRAPVVYNRWKRGNVRSNAACDKQQIRST